MEIYSLQLVCSRPTARIKLILEISQFGGQSYQKFKCFTVMMIIYVGILTIIFIDKLFLRQFFRASVCETCCSYDYLRFDINRNMYITFVEKRINDCKLFSLMSMDHIQAKIPFTGFLFSMTYLLLNDVVSKEMLLFRHAFGSETIFQKKSEPQLHYPICGLCNTAICRKVAYFHIEVLKTSAKELFATQLELLFLF